MSCLNRSIGLCLVLAVCIGRPVLGQTGAADPDETPTTRLVLQPAAPPAIAMQHRLLPRYLDLVPGNAAVHYLKALPEGGDVAIRKNSEKVEELLQQDRQAFQLEEARQVLDESMFEFMRLASLREDCDWNLPIRESDWYSVLLPELQSMRQFGRQLALRARVQIADGELEKAIETLRVGYVAARNTAKGPTLVNALVGVAIARMMNERLFELMQHPQAPNLYWSLATLPDPFIDVRQALDLESDGLYLAFPQLKDVATTTLTNEQWSARLAEFGLQLNKFGPLLGAQEDVKLWRDKLALGVTIAAMSAVHYPWAKADLESYGWPKERLDRMPVAQVILLHISQTYEIFRDDLFKWFHLPYWQSAAGMNAAECSLGENKSREILPLASLLLPAIGSARTAVVRLDREFAAIRTVEAIRFYAATHAGKLPARLEDILEVPIPLDPMTGKSFDYKLDGETATLEGKVPAGQRNHRAFRYVITIAEKTSAAQARAAVPPGPRNRAASAKPNAQQVASHAANTFVRVFTTNPIMEIGENRRRANSINNLRQLALAMHNYHDVHKHFPPAANFDQDGRPLLSWRVHVLPYLDQNELYRQFRLDEPWDSEHNKKLIEKMPEVFRVPNLPALPKHTTTYLVPFGEETAFHGAKGKPLKEFRDGTSKTILIVEADADQAVIWTRPADWQFDPQQPTRALGKLRGGRFLAVFADGAARELDANRDPEVLRRLFKRADGLPVMIP